MVEEISGTQMYGILNDTDSYDITSGDSSLLSKVDGGYPILGDMADRIKGKFPFSSKVNFFGYSVIDIENDRILVFPNQNRPALYDLSANRFEVENYTAMDVITELVELAEYPIFCATTLWTANQQNSYDVSLQLNQGLLTKTQIADLFSEHTGLVRECAYLLAGSQMTLADLENKHFGLHEKMPFPLDDLTKELLLNQWGASYKQ